MEARFADGSILKLTVLDSHLQFNTDYGELRIPVSDIRRIDFATRIGDELAREIVSTVGELGNDDYAVRERASEKLAEFRVTGGAGVRGGGFAGGAVWGTDIYTLDSTLSTTAVHAGALKSGETGVVSVTILGPQHSFNGSTRNGVSTSSWGAFPGGFKVSGSDEMP